MKKILLIDDEEDFTLLMRKKLESEGYEVIVASEGEEGVRKAGEAKPDLIICDLRMPKKSGFEVLKEIKSNTEIHAPFIMLTGLDDFEQAKEAYAKEADFYVSKTVDPDKLLSKIRTILNISKDRIW
jgi:sigma-B regulation protein RsbU (phosphoserine phosphatase)